MSENSEHVIHNFPESKVVSSNCLNKTQKSFFSYLYCFSTSHFASFQTHSNKQYILPSNNNLFPHFLKVTAIHGPIKLSEVFKIFKCSKVCDGRKTRRLLCPEHLAKLCHPLISRSHV